MHLKIVLIDIYIAADVEHNRRWFFYFIINLFSCAKRDDALPSPCPSCSSSTATLPAPSHRRGHPPNHGERAHWLDPPPRAPPTRLRGRKKMSLAHAEVHIAASDPWPPCTVVVLGARWISCIGRQACIIARPVDKHETLARRQLQ